MRRYTIAIALAAAALALAGCQSPEAKVESKQEQLKHLQDQWNALIGTYMADCPGSYASSQPPKCVAEQKKEREIESKIQALNKEIAAQ